MFAYDIISHPVLAILFTVAIAVCGGLLLLRFILGPTSLDRLACFEGLTLIFVSLAALWAAVIGTLWFFDVVLVVSLVGFLSTIAVAMFIERGEMDHD